MAQRKQHHENEQITVGFKASGKQAAIVHEAADKHGESASRYMKRILLEWAAADLGLPKSAIADDPAPAELRAAVSQAAALAGVSSREWMLRAAGEVARAALAEQSKAPARTAPTMRPPAPRPISGTRRAVRGG